MSDELHTIGGSFIFKGGNLHNLNLMDAEENDRGGVRTPTSRITV